VYWRSRKDWTLAGSGTWPKIPRGKRQGQKRISQVSRNRPKSHGNKAGELKKKRDRLQDVIAELSTAAKTTQAQVPPGNTQKPR